MKPILIVDDEAAIAELIRRTLAGAGYDCVAVTDGAAAADLLEREAFDLVLLDIMMPGVDGYDLLRWLRPGGMPVVFITAKGTTADKVKGCTWARMITSSSRSTRRSLWPVSKACCAAPGAARWRCTPGT